MWFESSSYQDNNENSKVNCPATFFIECGCEVQVLLNLFKSRPNSSPRRTERHDHEYQMNELKVDETANG